MFVLIVDMRKRIVREILDYPDQEENLETEYKQQN